MHQFKIIGNLTGAGRSNLNTAVGKLLASVMADNCCERQKAAYIYPSPWWLRMIWAVIKTFMAGVPVLREGAHSGCRGMGERAGWAGGRRGRAGRDACVCGGRCGACAG